MAQQPDNCLGRDQLIAALNDRAFIEPAVQLIRETVEQAQRDYDTALEKRRRWLKFDNKVERKLSLTIKEQLTVAERKLPKDELRKITELRYAGRYPEAVRQSVDRRTARFPKRCKMIEKAYRTEPEGSRFPPIVGAMDTLCWKLQGDVGHSHSAPYRPSPACAALALALDALVELGPEFDELIERTFGIAIPYMAERTRDCIHEDGRKVFADLLKQEAANVKSDYPTVQTPICRLSILKKAAITAHHQQAERAKAMVESRAMTHANGEAAPVKLWFENDTGNLRIEGVPTVAQLLGELDRKLGLFIGSVRSLELRDDAYMVRDERAGRLSGVWISWEDVVLLAQAVQSQCIPGMTDAEQATFDDVGAVCRVATIPRNTKPLADALGPLIFMFAKEAGQWPERIPCSRVDRLDRIRAQLGSLFVGKTISGVKEQANASPGANGDNKPAKGVSIAKAVVIKNYHASSREIQRRLKVKRDNPNDDQGLSDLRKTGAASNAPIFLDRNEVERMFTRR